MSNVNFNELMKMVSNMDKKELEIKMQQVSQMLKNKSPEQVMKEMSQNNNIDSSNTKHNYYNNNRGNSEESINENTDNKNNNNN